MWSVHHNRWFGYLSQQETCLEEPGTQPASSFYKNRQWKNSGDCLKTHSLLHHPDQYATVKPTFNYCELRAKVVLDVVLPKTMCNSAEIKNLTVIRGSYLSKMLSITWDKPPDYGKRWEKKVETALSVLSYWRFYPSTLLTSHQQLHR